MPLPACPVSHGAVGPSWTRARLPRPSFAHYSHYLASNQRRTGCWDLSTTYKGPGSLAELPASDPIRKGVHRGAGTQIGTVSGPDDVYEATSTLLRHFEAVF